MINGNGNLTLNKYIDGKYENLILKITIRIIHIKWKYILILLMEV